MTFSFHALALNCQTTLLDFFFSISVSFSKVRGISVGEGVGTDTECYQIVEFYKINTLLTKNRDICPMFINNTEGQSFRLQKR